MIDADDNRLHRLCWSLWSAILGHSHEHILSAIENQLKRGISFGASTEAEIDIAEKICKHVHSMDEVRLVTSGTEATMSAIRLARDY